MDPSLFIGCLFLAVLVVGVGILVSAIRIVPQYQRLVIFRFGNCIGQKGPGIVLLYPFGIDQTQTVDLREEVREVPHQTNITKDNASIGIDFLIYWQVVDAVKSVLEVGNWRQAALGIATTTLRAVIGDIVLDDVLAQREHINQVLRIQTRRDDRALGRKSDRGGNPRDRAAARDSRRDDAPDERRAHAPRVVTEAQGKREASITVAEGEKQAAILSAEGKKQAAILEAEGQRAAQVLFAEGFAVALDKVYATAQTVDAKTMTLQYFETLKAIGNSPSTKYIFPLELSTAVQALPAMIGAALNK